ncbi:MAG: MBL fold metallo-hydrolase [Acidobacteria bacterium]|nr:MAG: MBL fold metallo-hydrolase [Acidobacteriota bacterium]
MARLVSLALLLALPLARLHAQEASPRPATSRVGAVKIVVLSTMLADAGIGEGGFAALVEADGHRILFDTGARPDTVLQNARQLKVDLAGVRDVVLSHHHGDHTGGLVTLRREYAKADPEALGRAWVGRGIFLPRAAGPYVGMMTAVKSGYEAAGGRFVELDQPRELFPGVWITGPVPRVHPERNWPAAGRISTDDGTVEDNLPEDQALVFDTDRGLVALFGCGHAGVVNTLAYARRTVRDAPVLAVLGGLHLFQKDDATLDWTGDRLREFGVADLLGAHCTGLEAVYHLRSRLGLDRRHCMVGAVGASFTLDAGIDPLSLAR